MNKMQQLDLWKKRFSKIVDREIASLEYYKLLLKQYSHLISGTKLQQILRKFMADEISHVEMSKKLLAMVKAKQEMIEVDLIDEMTLPLTYSLLIPAQRFPRARRTAEAIAS